ncbi:unnamed protein product [Cylindrotheca closterium]|uniref:SAP domain-containing protein n=1 Tax=Cylindrotheca closterium TaxID=2856 RepID=A0AAD2JLZ4_9STRA|nr:unnamed protein product [Cylindrotheca closterium]
MRQTCLITLLALVTSFASVNGFILPSSSPFTSTRLYAELPDMAKMKASEMRKELESYGISTKSLLEKSEFVEALKKARAEGKTPVNGTTDASSSASSSTKAESSSSSSSTETPPESSSESSETRDKRYKEALDKAKKMKVGDLKKELEGRGISTKSFFEKPEFVKAYAEAVADNKKGKGGPGPRPEEPRDPAFKDVVMQKMSKGAMMGERVIDIMVR